MNDETHSINIDDYSDDDDDEFLDAPSHETDISVKDHVYDIIQGLKDSIRLEIEYFKTRTNYSISIILRSAALFLIALLFILVAFILLGVGILLTFKPIMGILWATIITVVIFLTLSVIMMIIGRFYIKKLSFPELSKQDIVKETEKDTAQLRK